MFILDLFADFACEDSSNSRVTRIMMDDDVVTQPLTTCTNWSNGSTTTSTTTSPTSPQNFADRTRLKLELEGPISYPSNFWKRSSQGSQGEDTVDQMTPQSGCVTGDDAHHSKAFSLSGLGTPVYTPSPMTPMKTGGIAPSERTLSACMEEESEPEGEAKEELSKRTHLYDNLQGYFLDPPKEEDAKQGASSKFEELPSPRVTSQISRDSRRGTSRTVGGSPCVTSVTSQPKGVTSQSKPMPTSSVTSQTISPSRVTSQTEDSPFGVTSSEATLETSVASDDVTPPQSQDGREGHMTITLGQNCSKSTDKSQEGLIQDVESQSTKPAKGFGLLNVGERTMKKVVRQLSRQNNYVIDRDDCYVDLHDKQKLRGSQRSSHRQQPRTYCDLALFTFLCCMSPLGIVALVFSVMSDVSYKDGNFEKSQRYSKVTCILSVIGIATTLLVAVALLICVFTLNIKWL